MKQCSCGVFVEPEKANDGNSYFTKCWNCEKIICNKCKEFNKTKQGGEMSVCKEHKLTK